MRTLKRWHSLAAATLLAGTASIHSACGGMAAPVAATAAEEGMGEKGGVDATGPYDPVDWPQQLEKGWTWGRTAGIFAETADKVWIFQSGVFPELHPDDAEDDSVASNGRWGHLPKRYRGLLLTGPRRGQEVKPRWEYTLITVNRDGKLVSNWSQHNTLFTRPHRIKISPYDPERHVWVVEDGNHQIFKFRQDGTLVQSWGEAGVPGDDERHFNRPTDIAWLPDGTFFVSDGDVNTRVLKFDKSGRFLMTWGTPGTGRGQFDTPHAIAVGRDRRVYVADRSNHRIQIFDEHGKYLDEWPDIPLPYSIFMSDDDYLWVADGWMHKIVKFDLQGRRLDVWGTWGNFPGGIWGPHQLSVDSEGNLYIAQVYNSRPSKYRPKPNAPRDRVIDVEIGWGR